MTSGWSLLASADNKTPADLNAALGSSLGAASKAISTAWAWDAATAKWKFYTPSLQGTALTDYISSKSYLPFASALSASDGFWLNVVAATPPATSTNALYLANDSIAFNDGYLPVAYTLAQFQSRPGITVKWPMLDIAALQFTLTDAGSFSVAAGQTVSAAVSVVDTAANSQAVIKFYIDNVAVSKSGSNVTLTVPAAPVAWAFGLLPDGSGAALQNMSTTVANASATLNTAANSVSSITLGSALNSALTKVGSTTSMSGTYKVTLVVTNLPLSLASGAALNTYTINIPKSLSDPSLVRTITGLGIEGYVTLVPR
ncbi:hypothetical protein GALL_427300 [mine drainage metagenome]|uniref:Uncharacterized protein n=1 Tax=mine drainage metagenome TaxID=410659 RepID=A0A1J5Q6H1_9ZZZZ